MSTRDRNLIYLIAALIMALCYRLATADAHEQIFPHTHPHAAFALIEDFLLTGLWISIWAGISYGGYRLARRMGWVRQ